jgi:hypothetical protein
MLVNEGYAVFIHAWYEGARVGRVWWFKSAKLQKMPHDKSPQKHYNHQMCMQYTAASNQRLDALRRSFILLLQSSV